MTRALFWCETAIALSRALPDEVGTIRLPRGVTLGWLAAGRSLALDPHLEHRRAAWTAYLDSGLECMAATADGSIVATAWFAQRDDLDFDRLRFRFARDQVYTFSLEVVPRLRDTGLAAAVQWGAWGRYRDLGFSRLIRLVSLDNRRALSLALRMGFRPCGRLRKTYVLFGHAVHVSRKHELSCFDSKLPWHRVPVGAGG